MYRIAKALASPNSGLEVKDRVWLKITIPKSFIGMYWLIMKLYVLSEHIIYARVPCTSEVTHHLLRVHTLCTCLFPSSLSVPPLLPSLPRLSPVLLYDLSLLFSYHLRFGFGRLATFKRRRFHRSKTRQKVRSLDAQARLHSSHSQQDHVLGTMLLRLWKLPWGCSVLTLRYEHGVLTSSVCVCVCVCGLTNQQKYILIKFFGFIQVGENKRVEM